MKRFDSLASLEVRSPYDGTRVGSVPLTGADGVERALDTAYRLFRDRRGWLPPQRRIEILSATASLMERDSEDLALQAAREGGKPLVDSRVEVARAIDGVRNCCELLRSEAGHVVPMKVNAASAGRVAFTQTEPIGVVVALSAFNHPLNLIVHQVAPAIAAGCPVIVKPASATPLSGFGFVAVLHEAGLPEEWCQALALESSALASELAADSRVAFLSFIGSARVGWGLRSRLAPGTRCALEHGGAAPVIVAADADLDQAVPALAKGGFYHAGQVCVSVQRVFAHASIAGELARRLADRASSLKVGDPTSLETEVGPLIRAGELERVHAWVEEAVAGGGILLCGGRPLSATCYPATVVLEPPADCRLSCEEVFGPVVAVYGYDDIDDALASANALPWAFQAAVFTRDHGTAMRVYNCLDASAVMLNDHTAFRVDWMPFAGLRQSGLGVGGIPYTFREMQVEKLFVGPSS
jgi:acyl-CoA reductase-like NAD-dependent aldehyde dehydrogenase